MRVQLAQAGATGGPPAYAVPVNDLGRRLRPSLLVLTLSLVLAGGLVGCGDGESQPSPEPESTTPSATESETGASNLVADIAASIRSDIGEEVLEMGQAECLAQQLVEDLGEESAREVADSNELDSLDAEQQQVVRTALNECVPGSAVGEILTVQFYDGLGASSAPTRGVVRCVGTQLDGRTGDILVEGLAQQSQGRAPEALIQAYEACVPERVIIDVYVATFEDEGASPEEARCVAEEFVGLVSLREVAQFGMSGGDPPPEMQAKIRSAVQACGLS